MADIEAMCERWAAAIDGFVSAGDILTVEKAREILEQALDDIQELALSLEKAENRVRATDARHAFHLHTLGIKPEGDDGTEAVDYEIQRLAAFGKLGRAAAIAEAAEDNDQAFDEAADRLWAGARELAALPSRDGVSTRTARLCDFTEVEPMSIAFRRTQRGFVRADFTDGLDASCSIQRSSAFGEEALWLGRNSGTHHHVTGDCLARMHLTRAMVAGLLPALTHFVSTGELPEPTASGQSSPPTDTERAPTPHAIAAAIDNSRTGEFDCGDCGHKHAGPSLAGICIGCACPRTAPAESTHG